MPALKFSYIPKLTDHGTCYVPLVKVVFTNPKNKKSVAVDCVVDSGADDTLINGAVAEVLGIGLRQGREHRFQGISQAPVVAYDHPVTIRLYNDTTEFPITCSFLPDLPSAGLLGQIGFFENYKVTFEHYKKRFELTPRKF